MCNDGAKNFVSVEGVSHMKYLHLICALIYLHYKYTCTNGANSFVCVERAQLHSFLFPDWKVKVKSENMTVKTESEIFMYI